MTKRNPIIAGILLRDLGTPRTLGDLRLKAMALRAKIGPISNTPCWRAPTCSRRCCRRWSICRNGCGTSGSGRREPRDLAGIRCLCRGADLDRRGAAWIAADLNIFYRLPPRRALFRLTKKSVNRSDHARSCHRGFCRRRHLFAGARVSREDTPCSSQFTASHRTSPWHGSG